jgi:cell wall-associated NlpC family hydrolase
MSYALKAGGFVVGAAVAVILGLVTLAGGAGTSIAAQGAVDVSVLGRLQEEECVPTGPVSTLTAAQSANAETIVAATQALGAGDHGAQIALMAAYTESNLENLGPETGNDGSLGLFQQRASEGWGTPAEEQDPSDATGMFVQRLLAVPNWESIEPWMAAQLVQHSASSNGMTYQANWGMAGTLLGAVTTLADGEDCGGEDGAEPAGPAAQFGLPTGYSIPTEATPTETRVLTYAISKLGDAYVWGAAGPQSFDCSGLTMVAWAQAGVKLDHYTGDQAREGTAVAGFPSVAPGDLVLIPGSDGTLADPGHVGIYIGYGLVLSATDPEQGVIVQTWVNFTAAGISGIRYLG